MFFGLGSLVFAFGLQQSQDRRPKTNQLFHFERARD
jgi:hypothetical protein